MIKIDLGNNPFDLQAVEDIIEASKKSSNIELVNCEPSKFISFISEVTRNLFGFNIPMPSPEPLDVQKGNVIKTVDGFKEVTKVRKSDDIKNLYIINTKDYDPEKEEK